MKKEEKKRKGLCVCLCIRDRESNLCSQQTDTEKAVSGPLTVILTFFLGLALHLEVHGGEAELVAVLSGQLPLLQAVADTEATSHRGHLTVELLPSDLVVEAQQAGLDTEAETQR